MALVALPTNFLFSFTREEVDAVRSALVDWGGLWHGESFQEGSVDQKRQERSVALRGELLELIEGSLLSEYHQEQERFAQNLAAHTQGGCAHER